MCSFHHLAIGDLPLPALFHSFSLRINNLTAIECADFICLTSITPLAVSSSIASSSCTIAAKMISQSTYAILI